MAFLLLAVSRVPWKFAGLRRVYHAGERDEPSGKRAAAAFPHDCENDPTGSALRLNLMPT